MRRFLVSILAFAAMIGLQALPVSAMTVAPAIIEVSVEPGKSISFDVVVTNDESRTMTYLLSMQKFIPQGDSGQLQFLPESDTSGLPDWMFLEAPTLTLRPGESHRMPVSLRVPLDAAPGNHSASIFLTQASLDSNVGQNVSAVPRIGILVFATVTGNLQLHSALNSVTVLPDVSSHLPVRFQTAVENLGNVLVVPNVSIEVKNVFGSTVAKLNANPDGARVLPGSKRVLGTTWGKSDVEVGTGFVHDLKAEWNNFGIGWYTATISLSTPEAGKQVQTVSFQIWPWRLALVSVVVLVILLVALRLMRSRRP